MSIQHVRSLFEAYCRLQDRNPLNQDMSLLWSAYDQVTDLAATNGYSKDTVHLTHRILSYLGNKGLHQREQLLRSYLNQPLHNDERFWANWELVDTLALLKKSKETITEQLLFLQWAKNNMDPKNWAAVMYDGTQALCWAKEGRMTEWFRIYYEIIQSIPPASENREHRATYVRTAGEFLIQNDTLGDALHESTRLTNIVNEDLNWSKYIIFWLGAATIRLEVYRKRKDWSQYDGQVDDLIAAWRNESIDLDKRKFIANDLGACLIWAGRYEQARSFLNSVWLTVRAELRTIGWRFAFGL